MLATVYFQTGPSIVKLVNNILNVAADVIGESERNNKSSKRYNQQAGKTSNYLNIALNVQLLFLSDEGPTLGTLYFTIFTIGSIFLYLDLYLAMHCLHNTTLIIKETVRRKNRLSQF